MKILPYRYETNKICTRCVIDETVPGINFDQNVVCTFCKIHDELETKYPLNEETHKRLQELVDKISEDGKGKDMTVLLV